MKAIGIMLLAVLLTGCASLDRAGRVGGAIGRLVAPEYAMTIDNVLAMLQDEQIFTDVTFYAITPDGRRYDLQDVRIGARATEPTWAITEVPPGVMRRVSKQPLPQEAEDQRQMLANALRAIPSTEDE